MTIDDKIRNENLEYNINRGAAKAALLSGKIDKQRYLTGEEILTYSPFGKALENQKDQGRKQIYAMMSKKDGQVGLINNDGKNLYFKEIFEKRFRKRFDKIIESMDEKKLISQVIEQEKI